MDVMRGRHRFPVWMVMAVAIFASVILFDVAVFWLAPENVVSFASAYRQPAVRLIPRTPEHAHGYPKDYFVADESLGFDIAENIKKKRHFFAGDSAEVFSNDLGCFDHHSLTEIKNASRYEYFAGDSFTWGYASYESKFPVVYEKLSRRFSVKCGVTHTGQLHQFGKFKRIVERIGHYPERVFVGYVSNDPANDFAHPHTTVIRGFLVEKIELRDNALVSRDLGDVAKAINKYITSEKGREAGVRERADSILSRYSITYNIVNETVKRLLDLTEMNKVAGKGREPVSFYSLYQNGMYDLGKHYINNPVTERNRGALSMWIDDSRKNGYELIFVLIPRRDHHADMTFYSGLRAFLKSRSARYLDLTEDFAVGKFSVSDLYWEKDGHLSDRGNEIVGKILSDSFH